MSPEGKLLKGALTRDSPHYKFWEYAITVLGSLKYIKNGQRKSIPTIPNWINTLKNFKYIFEQHKEFKFLCLRNFNQDPLENFFGCIRSHGNRNINPTPQQFVYIYKTLILNNFTAHHSAGANCELDDSELLSDLNVFFSLAREEEEQFALTEVIQLDPIQILEDDGTILEKNIHSYVAGYVLKCVKKDIKNCPKCMSNFVSGEQDAEENTTLITAREYKPNALLKANKKFRVLFSTLSRKCIENISNIIIQSNIQMYVKHLVVNIVKHTVTQLCDTHDIIDCVLKRFINYFIFTYVKHINNVLLGKVMFNINDPLSKVALDKYKKNKYKNFAIAKIKQLQ